MTARETFGRVLATLIARRDGASQYTVGLASGMHPSYVNRLARGKREPSREIVDALCRGLDTTAPERRALLAAAGYLPCTWATELDALAELLAVAEAQATPTERKWVGAQVLGLVRALAEDCDRRWRGEGPGVLWQYEHEQIPLGIV